jgi:hypothetical protein
MGCRRQHYHIEPCGGGSNIVTIALVLIGVAAVAWVANHIEQILIVLAITAGAIVVLTLTSIGCIIALRRTRPVREVNTQRDIPVITYSLYPELEERRDTSWLTDQQRSSKRIGD